MSTEEILAAALALPEAERRALVERLAESLPERGDVDAYDAEYEAELDRREAQIEADPSRLIPGEIVFAELQAKLTKVRAAG